MNAYPRLKHGANHSCGEYLKNRELGIAGRLVIPRTTYLGRTKEALDMKDTRPSPTGVRLDEEELAQLRRCVAFLKRKHQPIQNELPEITAHSFIRHAIQERISLVEDLIAWEAEGSPGEEVYSLR